jgi:inorganic pyrophosphatase
MRLRRVHLLWILLLANCDQVAPAPQTLPEAPAGLKARVAAYLEAAKQYPEHAWRDVPPRNADGTINGYIEIPRGESQKWEFRIPLNRREVDRVIPAELGGYPINYGFMPQTVSYDGDPADVLVLGPALDGGTLVRGRIVGLMEMTDTGDLDSKVIISPLDGQGRPTHELTDDERRRMAQFFDNYKKHQGKPTKVTGWGDRAAAEAFLEQTGRFFAAR